MKNENKYKVKTLFDHIKAITQYQDPDYWDKLTEDDKKTWNLYMINRYLSMNPDWIDVVNYLQEITYSPNMSPRNIYLLYINVFPQSNIFLKYMKKSKKTNYNSKLIDIIAEYFKLSKREAIMYLDLCLNDNKYVDDVINSVMSLGYTEKEAKKLLK